MNLTRHPGVMSARLAAGARTAGFTLIELILVLALLVIITSLAIPPMARFIRGRALDSEAERFLALAHAAQSRAVSEGQTVLLWVDAQQGAYGTVEETPATGGDPKAETLHLDTTLQIAVLANGAATGATGRPAGQAAGKTASPAKNLPAIRFLADGTVDEDSALTLQLTDADGFRRLLVASANHTAYEIGS